MLPKLTRQSHDASWQNFTLVYRKYATLYIVAIVDERENLLSTLDLIHLFVQTLDKVFPNVTELDIVFNYDKIMFIVRELIQGGLLIEPSSSSDIPLVCYPLNQ